MHKLWLAFEGIRFSCPAGSFFPPCDLTFWVCFFFFFSPTNMKCQWMVWHLEEHDAVASEQQRMSANRMVVSRLSTLQSLSTDIRAQKWYCFIKKMFILNWRGNVNEVLYQPSHEVSFYIEGSYSVCSSWWRSAWYFRLFQKKRFNSFFYEVCGLRFVQKTKGKIPHQRGKKHHYTLRKSLFFLTLFHTNSSVAKKI